MKTQDRYKKLQSLRETYLNRARECASFTLPFVLPREDNGDWRKELPEPRSSVGGNSVNSLVGKLLVSLHPARPNFRITLPLEIVSALQQTQNGQSMAMELELINGKVEKGLHDIMEANNWRGATAATLTNLIITGNCCEMLMPNNEIRIYALDEYVVVRDRDGRVIELITQECYTEETLPPHLRQYADPKDASDVGSYYGTRRYKIYTHSQVNVARGVYEIHQSVGNTIIPNSFREIEIAAFPYNVLRYNFVSGESYGRGLVETVLPDLKSLNALADSLLDIAAVSARMLYRVGAEVDTEMRRKMASAPNGTVIVAETDKNGKPPIDLIQADNANQANVVLQQYTLLRESVSEVFLRSSGAVRDSERTTAEEVRIQRNELENGLGGFYSRITADLLQRRVQSLIISLQRNKLLPDYPFGAEIITGVEALSREKDVQAASILLQMMQGMPPENLQYLDMPVLLGHIANGVGLPNIVRSEEAVQEMRQQQMAEQALLRGGERAAEVAGEQLAGATVQQPQT